VLESQKSSDGGANGYGKLLDENLIVVPAPVGNEAATRARTNGKIDFMLDSIFSLF
jgi:hypothetical protein